MLSQTLYQHRLASGGSVLEPAGTGSIRHGGSFWQLLTEAVPVAPHYQNLATQIQHKEEQAVGRQWQRSGEGEGAGQGAGLSSADPNASSCTKDP